MNSVRQESTNNLNAGFTTAPLNISNMNSVGVQINVVTTANTGVFTPQCTNDINPLDASAVWETIDDVQPGAIDALADADVQITVSLVDLPFAWFRMKFTLGTGTNGTATTKIFAKDA